MRTLSAEKTLRRPYVRRRRLLISTPKRSIPPQLVPLHGVDCMTGLGRRVRWIFEVVREPFEAVLAPFCDERYVRYDLEYGSLEHKSTFIFKKP